MRPRLSLRKRLLFSATVLAIFVLLLEIGMRLCGYEPWHEFDLEAHVEPGGTLYQPHPIRGYMHRPGEFRITLHTGYTYRNTRSLDSLRITHPPRSDDPHHPRKEIWIFGCSMTEGWSVNDEETYAWVLQEKLPDKEVRNFGVNGYGTLQSLMQFREGLAERNPPETVIVAYARFHDDRNAFLRRYRKVVVPYNRLGALVFPYARLDADGALQIHSPVASYAEFPLMRQSALMHFLEQAYNVTERWTYRSHDVSKAIIRAFADECSERNIRFIVAGLHSESLDLEMMTWCRQQGIEAVNISVPDYSNWPHDPHPRPAAHRQYAEKLHAFLIGERGQ